MYSAAALRFTRVNYSSLSCQFQRASERARLLGTPPDRLPQRQLLRFKGRAIPKADHKKKPWQLIEADRSSRMAADAAAVTDSMKKMDKKDKKGGDKKAKEGSAAPGKMKEMDPPPEFLAERIAMFDRIKVQVPFEPSRLNNVVTCDCRGHQGNMELHHPAVQKTSG